MRRTRVASRGRSITGAIALVSAVSVTGCSTATGGGGAGTAHDDTAGVSSTEIHLGISNALTGPVAAVCLPASQGAQSWFEMVNDAGGVHGREVVVDVLDDASDAPRAVANVRELTGQGVFAMFGGCGTVSAAAISSALEGTDVPYLFPYAALPDLLEPVHENVFSLLPLYRDQAFTGVSTIVGAEPGSVYTVTSQIPGYESTVAGATAGVEAAGGTLTASSLLPATNAPAEQEAAKVGQKSADYLAMTVLAPDAARLLNALAGAGDLPRKAVIGSSPFAAQSFADALDPRAASLLRVLSPTVPPTDERAQECVAALQKYSPDTKPDALALFGCAAAQVLVAGLEAAGEDLTRSGLVSALEGMSGEEISPLLPPVNFSAERHLGPESMFLLGLDSDGGYTVEDTIELETAP